MLCPGRFILVAAVHTSEYQVFVVTGIKILKTLIFKGKRQNLIYHLEKRSSHKGLFDISLFSTFMVVSWKFCYKFEWRIYCIITRRPMTSELSNDVISSRENPSFPSGIDVRYQSCNTFMYSRHSLKINRRAGKP